MRQLLSASAILAATTTLTSAGGLDRSGQSILSIFDEDGTYSASIGYVTPSLKGTDTGGSGATYSAGNSYTQLGFSFTNEINDRLSYGVIYDQPFGADIFYNGDPTTAALAGTRADISSNALSVLGRYKFNDNFSVFGGLKLQQAGGKVSLNGTAYGNALATAGAAAQAGTTTAVLGAALQGSPTAFAALPAALQSPAALQAIGAQVQQASAGFTAAGGYNVDIEQTWGTGFIVGAAYEIPDIAMRLAITYHSEIGHDGGSVETAPFPQLAGAGNTPFDSPESINLDFQTGIAADTLLLASLRWTNWGDFDVIPPNLGSDLANLNDSYRWSLGVGRRFNENLSGSAILTYEKDDGSATSSPLAPNDGQIGLTVGGRYEKDNLTVSGGINYTMLGDTEAGVGGQPVASFRDSSAVGVGLRVNFKF